MELSKNWIIEGLVFAALLLVINALINLVLGEFTFDQYWKRVVISIIGGLLYGFVMNVIRKNNKR